VAVTRSTAAERRLWEAAAPAAGGGRRREAALLAAALAVVVLGLVLTYLATARSIAGIEARLASGEVIDLNAVGRPEDLLRVLTPLGDRAERSFAAGEIWRHLEGGGVQNVGALAAIRVPASAVEDDPRLIRLNQRLAMLREGAAPEEEAAELTVPLLSESELRAIKDRLVVRRPDEYRGLAWTWSSLALAGFVAVHLVWRRRRFQGDELVLPLLLLLSGLGLMLMLAVRDPLRDLPLIRAAAQGVLLGCALLLGASLADVERSPLRRMTFAPLFAAVLLSILLIQFGSGPGTSDAKVNLLGFQPVEVIKILIVLFLAGYFVERWEFLRELTERRSALGWLPRHLAPPRFEYALPPIAAMGVVLLFFFLQRDLGPALVLGLLFLLLYAVARGRAVMALAGVGVVLAGFWAGYQLGFPRNVAGRISMWLSPWDNTFRGGDHLAHSLWALAAGAAGGAGPGLGEPARVPAAHTDMVLAAAGEELGFVGLLAIFALYVVLVARAFRATLRAGGIYSFFLALGATLLLAVQILIIAGGVVGAAPLAGVVTPFLSYGRSAMLANFFLVGLLLAVSARPGDGALTRPFRTPVRWVALALALAMAGIVARAAQVQLVQADQMLVRGALTLQADGYRRYQYNPRLVEIAELLPRGTIVDRHGLPLATGDPAVLARHRAALARLGATIDPGPLAVAAADGATAAGPGSAPAAFSTERLYPFGGRTFHLLGDLNNRVNWSAGNTTFAERDAAARLQGWEDFAGVVEVEQLNGLVTPVARRDYGELVPLLRHRHDPEHPEAQRLLRRDRTLRMSIDVRLQLAVGEILRRATEKPGHGGAAVVLDADSGELLASVSYPWPRRLPVEPSEDPESGVIDRARYGIYPPGSTFKLVTAIAALREDTALAEQTFRCVPLGGGRFGNRVPGWGRPIRDDPIVKSPHGTVNLEKGIRVSCNAYFAQLLTLEVGAEPLLETARLLGISVAQPNTVEELSEALPPSAYGQGEVVTTPLQMALVAAAVARGGTAPEVRWTVDPRDAPLRGEPVAVVSPESAALLARAMRGVVTHGSAAGFLGGVLPPIAGKTGTAQVQDKDSHSWFIGFAPYGAAQGRRIAFAVIVEHGGYGGRLAAPAAGEIVRAASALGLLGAPPKRAPAAARTTAAAGGAP
jgi:cell division protein FtsW (lipid II flippase)